MEKQQQHINSNNSNNNRQGVIRSITTDQTKPPVTTSSQFVLQWGNRKRLRCMKVQVKDNNNNNDLQHQQVPSGPRIRARVDRRVVRPDPNLNQSNGHLNLRPRPASPAQRVLRNSESTGNMKGAQSNGVGQDKKVVVGNSPSRTTTNSNKNNNCNNTHNEAAVGGGGSSEKGGSSSGSEPGAVIWPPKFVLGLTNKEKEEDFLAIKGSKLPHRPKKRAKFIQRTLNLVSPGAWLCDLTLERYEVRERKVNKKRPRGLKAMGNMVDSESE
ncbi:uncharacterized protein LOC141684166 [Apium graveolens]|uniref:uncharacterized protein LOC141684166 n=1 Tax=Apium graveolens TaxID=4045 RepID=UPI003D7983D5